MHLARVQVVMARPDLDGELRDLMLFPCGRCHRLRRLHLSERANRLLHHAGATLVSRP